MKWIFTNYENKIHNLKIKIKGKSDKIWVLTNSSTQQLFETFRLGKTVGFCLRNEELKSNLPSLMQNQITE